MNFRLAPNSIPVHCITPFCSDTLVSSPNLFRPGINISRARVCISPAPQIATAKIRDYLACVASVSVRLSVRSMHFSLFWPRENWGWRKKVSGPSPLLPSVWLAPIFAQPKSEKRLQRTESPTETLATQARDYSQSTCSAA